LEIQRFTRGGVEAAKDNTVVSRNDDGSLTVSFKDSDDTITVKFTGELAKSSDVAIDFIDGGFVIRPLQGAA
jgi:hypothetical protein